MARKRKNNNKKIGAPVLRCLIRMLPVEVGATEIYIAVPADHDPQPVRHFSTFAGDLHAAADWLKSCQIEAVAMESTEFIGSRCFKSWRREDCKSLWSTLVT